MTTFFLFRTFVVFVVCVCVNAEVSVVTVFMHVLKGYEEIRLWMRGVLLDLLVNEAMPSMSPWCWLLADSLDFCFDDFS